MLAGSQKQSRVDRVGVEEGRPGLGAPGRLGTRKEAITPSVWETARGTWWPQSSLSSQGEAGDLHPRPGLQLGI